MCYHFNRIFFYRTTAVGSFKLFGLRVIDVQTDRATDLEMSCGVLDTNIPAVRTTLAKAERVRLFHVIQLAECSFKVSSSKQESPFFIMTFAFNETAKLNVDQYADDSE